MKSSVLVLLALLIFAGVNAQNRKPKIIGQEPLSANEDESITILMNYLHVEDADDWFYPWGFTMTIYPGSDYSASGNIVTPAKDFAGVLKVKVSVHDGHDESNKFDLEITVNAVNDKPVITGHTALSIKEGESVTLELSYLTVTDPDDKYPDDFTLKVHAGSNYTVNGTTVTPQPGFSGSLSVTVAVNDGQVDSDQYDLPVEVKPVNRVPKITGQVPLQVVEDESIVITLAHLTVEDEDNNYPQGFTLTLSPGDNYIVKENYSVMPGQDFYGRLSVPVTVNDGKNTSAPFSLVITVTPVNDVPVVTDLETVPLFYGSGESTTLITQSAKVKDVDGDSIMFATIGFRQSGYQPASDKLVYAGSNPKIKGVFDAGTGILTLLGQASPASYTTALRSVQFQTVAPVAETRVLYVVVNDGKTQSDAVERILRHGQEAVSLDIPSGFTPNGDQANDTWKIVPLKSEEAYSGARIQIYNKSGVLVYESVGLDSEWDGRMNGELLPADTYFYTIDLNTNTPEGYLKGLVTLLR